MQVNYMREISPNLITMKKSTRMARAGHASRRRKRRTGYETFVGNSGGMTPWTTKLKWVLKKQDVKL